VESSCEFGIESSGSIKWFVCKSVSPKIGGVKEPQPEPSNECALKEKQSKASKTIKDNIQFNLKQSN
jgi:hypothetical protein